MLMITLYAEQKKRHRFIEQSFGLWEKARVGCFKRTASKHVYYQGWNWSPAQVGCMRQVLGPGALGRPRGMGWRGRWEGASGWGMHVNPWLIHVNVWQKPLQYCKVITLQLIKINGKKIKKKKKKKECSKRHWLKWRHSGQVWEHKFCDSESQELPTSHSLSIRIDWSALLSRGQEFPSSGISIFQILGLLFLQSKDIYCQLYLKQFALILWDVYKIWDEILESQPELWTLSLLHF